MPEHPYQRSDPGDLARQKQLIQNREDQMSHQNVLDVIGKLFDDAVKRHQRDLNPPPDLGGAEVVGFKPPRTDA